MTVSPTLKALAARIWEGLPGEAPDKAYALKFVMSELRSARDMAMVEHRQSKSVVIPQRKLRTTTENMISQIVGQPPSKGHEFRVLIHGVNTLVVDVFKIAAIADHPLRPACQAFLDEHRLYLKPIQRKPGARGRAPLIIAQAPAPSPTPEEALQTVKAATAGVLERQELRHVATAGRSTILDAVTAENLALYRQTMAATMTDHSGGKVSDVTVERGSEQ